MRGVPVFGGGARAAGFSFCLAVLALFAPPGAALAQQTQRTAPAPAPSPLPIQIPLLSSPPAAQKETATPHSAPPTTAASTANLSKFEARRVRHACHERANEKALKGKEREDFLLGCIFGRSAMRRTVRRECRKQGLAKGLDRAALHDFMHQCAEAYYAAHPQKPAE